MTIYIAICDDNVADRKQCERLLEREKDTRLKTNYDVLYIDSFGSEEALMRTPIKYDIFFIDITEGAHNGMDIAKKIRKNGITAPIVLCSSSINYASFVSTPKDIVLLEKPITQGQISHLIDVAMDFSKKKDPLIELRCKSDTIFVTYDEIIKAVPKGKFLTEVFLSDGRIIAIMDSIQTLKNQCVGFGCYIECGNELVNLLHIKSSADKGFYLSNEDYVKYGFTQKDAIISAFGNYIHRLNNK